MTVTLYHGDCLDIMPTLPQVDAIITDLPYGTTACSWDEIIPFEPMWKEVKRICKGAFVTTASQPFTSKLVMSNPDYFKYEWVWEKPKATGHASCNLRPMKAHENIEVFSKNGHIYNPQKTGGIPYKGRNKIGYPESKEFSTGQGNRNDNTGTRFPRTVIKVNNSYYSEKQTHPTQKPVALYEYLVRTYTNEGDTVLDICAGSGTTGVACVNTGRNFIGIELREDYFKVMETRIKEAQQQMRLPL